MFCSLEVGDGMSSTERYILVTYKDAFVLSTDMNKSLPKRLFLSDAFIYFAVHKELGHERIWDFH